MKSECDDSHHVVLSPLSLLAKNSQEGDILLVLHISNRGANSEDSLDIIVQTVKNLNPKSLSAQA
jgi:hypothetical protein